jgi:hypothetical protein
VATVEGETAGRPRPSGTPEERRVRTAEGNTVLTPVGGELGADGGGEAHGGELAGVVDGHAGNGDLAGHGGDVDDVAPAARDHVGQDKAHAVYETERFTSMVVREVASGSARKSPSGMTPALLTRTSMRPKESSTAETQSENELAGETSAV